MELSQFRRGVDVFWWAWRPAVEHVAWSDSLSHPFARPFDEVHADLFAALRFKEVRSPEEIDAYRESIDKMLRQRAAALIGDQRRWVQSADPR